MTIRTVVPEDFPRLLEITIQAFTPIHESFRQMMGESLYALNWANWKQVHEEYLKSTTQGEAARQLLVGELEGEAIGYAHYTCHEQELKGEIGLNAIHPDHQGKGLSQLFYAEAERQMKAQGMKQIVVGTGGDPSHLPARKSYEKAGFQALPHVTYYKLI